jgi:predicted transcriptional regulator
MLEPVDKVSPPVDNSQVLQTRVSRKVREALEELARRNERSVASEIRIAIKERLARENGSKAA